MIGNRGNWANKFEFIFSAIGYSVGLGNIWRFPYLCMINGGGAFLIPYFLFLVICGAPMYLVEISIGQYSSKSAIGCWNFAPIFKGIGWSMLAISCLLCLYYNAMLGWVIYYFAMSFTRTLPWTLCNQWWNTKYCYSFDDIIKSNLSFKEYVLRKNISLDPNNPSQRWRSSAEEFYLFNTLQISSSIDVVGGFNKRILLCFCIAWLLTYLCISKGIKTTGKVIYVTALAPYVLLTMIIIQGSLLPGSLRGIKFYVIPKWKTLSGVQVWTTAATQIFYSLGPAWGGLISMGSFNKFNMNVVRFGIAIPIVCCLTSFYAGFAIFSIIGYMASAIDIEDITKVIESGPGLAFVAYPEALALIPGSSFWSVLFFLTLWTMGLDSMFATLETVVQGIADSFTFIRGKIRYICTGVCCTVLLLLGLPFTTRAGGYIFQVVDWYSTPIGVLIIAIIESIAISYFYNCLTLINHIEAMISMTMPKIIYYWLLGCMCLLTPLSLLIIFINLIAGFSRPIFDKSKEYPNWAVGLGWSLAILVIIPIPVVAIVEIFKSKENWKSVFKPNDSYKELLIFREKTSIEREREAVSLVELKT